MNSLRSGLRCLRDIGVTARNPMQRNTSSFITPKAHLARRSLTTTGPQRSDELSLTKAFENSSVEAIDGEKWVDDPETNRLIANALRPRVPYARPMPVSPSYFSRTSKFIDSYVNIQHLMRKYGRLPTVRRDEAEVISWKTKDQYRLAIGEPVPAREFTQCMAMVKHLWLIHPDLMPEEVRTGVRIFQRDIRGLLNRAARIVPDKFGRTHGVGRRKTSTARAWVVEGSGEVLVNGKPINEFFGRVHDRESALWALKSMERMDKYNIWALVEGGGTTGQAEALAMAIGKCLSGHEPALRSRIRKGKSIDTPEPLSWEESGADVKSSRIAGCLTRDPRMVERKKTGHIKARKSPTWVKR